VTEISTEGEAQAYGIPYCTIDKATRRQLTESLNRLFPTDVIGG
jgi:hypothetical protein